MKLMPSEIQFWQSTVKDFPIERLQAEAKSFTFIKKNMEKTGIPFNSAYLDALNEEIKLRYKVEGI